VLLGKKKNMKGIIDGVSLAAVSLGVLYFVMRFVYFSVRGNIEFEIKNITSFQYFLPLKRENVNSGQEWTVSVLLNVLLSVFYILFIMTFLISIFSILSNELI